MKRILICEDDEILHTIVSHRISIENIAEIVNAFDGKEAKTFLSEQNFDLIITDLHMPFHTGLELTTFVRENLKRDTPIIILTGEGLESAVLKAFELGADDYITKPFDPTELISKIKRFLK